MTFAAGGGGYLTTINVCNYYSDVLFEDGFVSAAWLDVHALDADGRTVLDNRIRLAPNASAHIDVGRSLDRGDGAPQFGTVYCRLVPDLLPAGLDGPYISTEYTAELEGPGGHRTFFHNTLGPTPVATFGTMRSGQLFSDKDAQVRYLILASCYFGRRTRFLSDGRARVSIVNCQGARLSALSSAVPARGLRLFDFNEHFPAIDTFLDGKGGHLELAATNLLRKPWVWLVSRSNPSAFSIEHL